MKIPTTLIPEAYDVSKAVYEGKLTHGEGVKSLVGDNRMNKNSAADYINNFKYMMEGRRFTRTNNAYSIDYFLQNILKDYGVPKLSNALEALKQHIEYYEGIEKVQMHKMREILQNYSDKVSAVSLVTNLDDLTRNISTLEDCLTSRVEQDRSKASQLVKDGICFIAYRIGDELRFAPSKFSGYMNNTLEKHIPGSRDGRETNIAISQILGFEPVANETLESKYLDYCQMLGISPSLEGGGNFRRKRKFWTLVVAKEFAGNEEQTGEFPEGKIVERIHRARERNSKVIQIAKETFKEKHGSLFCQICKFNFETRYGSIGLNFIEGHHTIPVSEMAPDHKTKPEDIAMLCSNCHRMVHKRRPWLSMEDLNQLLKTH